MTPRQQAAAVLMLGIAASGAPAFAQSGTRTAPAQASIDACALVEVDADRLACYDRVAGRRTPNPAQADAAAALARRNREAARAARPAERRVGKAGVRTCRSRWAQ